MANQEKIGVPEYTMPAVDYYEVLGVKPSATPEEIQRAFKRLSRKHHPDRFQGKQKKNNEVKFALVSQAYHNLKNPELRKIYDEMKREAEASASKKQKFFNSIRPGLKRFLGHGSRLKDATSKKLRNFGRKTGQGLGYVAQGTRQKMFDLSNNSLFYRSFQRSNERDMERLERLIYEEKNERAINFVIEQSKKGQGQMVAHLKKLALNQEPAVIEAIHKEDKLRNLLPFLMENNLQQKGFYESLSSKEVLELSPQLLSQALLENKEAIATIEGILDKNDKASFEQLVGQKDNLVVKRILKTKMNDFKWSVLEEKALKGDVTATEFLLELASSNDSKAYEIMKRLVKSSPESVEIISSQMGKGASMDSTIRKLLKTVGKKPVPVKKEKQATSKGMLGKLKQACQRAFKK